MALGRKGRIDDVTLLCHEWKASMNAHRDYRVTRPERDAEARRLHGLLNVGEFAGGHNFTLGYIARPKGIRLSSPGRDHRHPWRIRCVRKSGVLSPASQETGSALHSSTECNM